MNQFAAGRHDAGPGSAPRSSSSSRLHPPPLLQLLAAAAAAAAAAPCANDDDCAQLGVCSAQGSCACFRGFTGASCGELDLLPAAPLAAGSQLWPLPGADAEASAWGFTGAVLDEADGLYHAVATVACGANGVLLDGGGESWLAHLTSAGADGPWAFAGMFAPQTTFGPHLVVAPDGTFALYFRVNELVNATLCAGGGRDPLPNATTLAGSLVPPTSIVSGDPSRGTSIYVAWATTFAGPWSVARVNITGGDRGGDVLHKSNPSVALLQQPVGADKYVMSYRVNFDGSINAVALAEDFRGPFRCIVNITAQPGEDPFVFQIRGQDPMLAHVILHNGPHGYHSWGRLDGSPWHVDLVDHAFELNVTMADGSQLNLLRRERPELLWRADGTPRALINGVQGPRPNAIAFEQQLR
jgi:hypothetical protein